MSKQIKPWSSFTEQLERLTSRGMEVDNNEGALSYLERVGYYRLSGYWYPFREGDLKKAMEIGRPVRKDSFIKNSRFEDVVQLYIFDKKLRLLALDALERIEMAVRVDVAHLLGEKDPLAHEKPECLHGNFTKQPIKKGADKGKIGHEIWLEKYRSFVARSKKETFVQHNLKEYGSLPIWVAIELWDFGLLSKLFAGMQHKDKQIIAEKYGAEDGEKFAQWLRSLNYLRNVSAHHSRLWNINVVERSSVPTGWSEELSNKRPFLYFCIMQQMMNVICPNSSWGKRFNEMLTVDFPMVENRAISLLDFGVVIGWDAWELWS